MHARVEGESGEGEDPVPTGQCEWDERGQYERREGVPERLRERVAAAVRAGLGQALATCGNDDATRGKRSTCSLHEKAILANMRGRDALDTARVHDFDARGGSGAYKRVENSPSLVCRRKEFARLFFLEIDTARCKEGDCLANTEPSQHSSDLLARTSEVVPLRDGAMSDIAAAAPRDEDFRAECAR
jgi:hypothetical protein